MFIKLFREILQLAKVTFKRSEIGPSWWIW